MLGIGIIGCGAIASRRHAPEYAARNDCRIVGVYDQNFHEAQRLAEKHNAKACKTLDELLDNTAIDAVSVCTSNDTHASATIAACNAHKHVLCEKPMATTTQAAERMIEVAKSNGVILMIAQNQRLDSAHAAAKELLESGKMGKVLSFQTTFSHAGPEGWLKTAATKNVWFFNAARTGFGVLGDLGVHKIDLMRWLLDDEVVDASGYTGTLDKRLEDGSLIAVEDNAAIILRFRSGAIGSMLFSWTSYGAEDNSTFLNCQNGIIRLHCGGKALQAIRKDGTILAETEVSQESAQNSGIVDLFVTGIRSGYSPIPGEDGLRALRILERCLQTAEKHNIE